MTDDEFAWRFLGNLNQERQRPSWGAKDLDELQALEEARMPFWAKLELADIRLMRDASRYGHKPKGD